MIQKKLKNEAEKLLKEQLTKQKENSDLIKRIQLETNKRNKKKNYKLIKKLK